MTVKSPVKHKETIMMLAMPTFGSAVGEKSNIGKQLEIEAYNLFPPPTSARLPVHKPSEKKKQNVNTFRKFLPFFLKTSILEQKKKKMMRSNRSKKKKKAGRENPHAWNMKLMQWNVCVVCVIVITIPVLANRTATAHSRPRQLTSYPLVTAAESSATEASCNKCLKARRLNHTPGTLCSPGCQGVASYVQTNPET